MNSIQAARESIKAQRVRAGQSVLTGWLDSLKPDSSVSWREVEPEGIAAAISSVTAAGHGITFGRTSDGGALSLTLLVGGTPRKLYSTTAAQAEDLLSHLAHFDEHQ